MEPVDKIDKKIVLDNDHGHGEKQELNHGSAKTKEINQINKEANNISRIIIF
jgi:hypothetical protein